jgi:hypothetical protein
MSQLRCGIYQEVTHGAQKVRSVEVMTIGVIVQRRFFQLSTETFLSQRKVWILDGWEIGGSFRS